MLITLFLWIIYEISIECEAINLIREVQLIKLPLTIDNQQIFLKI